jgi:hypothetical protein
VIQKNTFIDSGRRTGRARTRIGAPHNRPYHVVKVSPLLEGSSDRIVRWIRTYGVFRLQRSLGSACYRIILSWIRQSNRVSPHPSTVRQIIALSQLEPLSDGPLTYEDFYGPVSIESHTEQTVRRTMSSQRQILTRRAI